MKRNLVSLVFVAVLLGGMLGCAQTRKATAPLAWWKKDEPEKVAATEPAPFKPPKAEASKAEASKEEPAKVADAKPPKSAEAEKSEPAKETTAATDAKPPEAKAPEKTEPKDALAGSSHDAETLKLIEEELASLSAEERDKLFAEWKSLDGAMVRQVIRIRGMVRELEGASPAGKSIAGTSKPGTLPGTADPWNSEPHLPVPSGDSSRTLALGPSEATNIVEGEPIAQASSSLIQPVGHTANSVPATSGATSTQPVSVLEAIAGTAAGANANGKATTGQAVSGNVGDNWSDQVRQLIASAESRAEQAKESFVTQKTQGPADDSARQHYVQSQVHLRLLYLMAGEQARAMQAIPELEPADQEFWQQVLWGVANYFDDAALPQRSDRVTQTVEQLRAAIAKLQGEANLQLRNVAFCHKITSFGNFERFDRDEYTSGQKVLLYAEVLNFKSVPQPSDGLFKTQLKSTIEIFRAGEGQPFKKIDFDPTIDLCRSYRQDYFHSYELKIPAEVTIGPHVLKLTIEDVQSGKLATYSVNFTVK